MAFYLPPEVDFLPHPLLADHDGFLAMGSHLSISNLLLAYQFGIFPWNNEGDPVMWWYTHPRFVLFPQKIKIQKSMRPYLNGQKFNFSFDKAFEEVIDNCKSTPRHGQDCTWIHQELEEAMIELHKQGVAHSVEVWKDQKLVGGLYGLALGKIFFGESMFAHESNASKFALIKLSQYLQERDFTLIDCQQESSHLKSLGAELIDKEVFLKYLKSNIFEPNAF